MSTNLESSNNIVKDRPSTALVTASYLPDLERCRLLSETIDRHVSNFSHHYILVEQADVASFRSLQSPHRTIVSEADILPGWLRPYPDPLSFFKRRIWLSLRSKPLRGWHVQQLRRIAIARHVDEDCLFYCDSDVAFLRPFDCHDLWRDDRLRLYRQDNALQASGMDEHRIWSANAGRILALDPSRLSPHDYIGTLVSWRRESVNAMCSHIEEAHHRQWMEVLTADRRFSECILYGRYADEVETSRKYYHDATPLCHVYWREPAPSPQELRAFLEQMDQQQVAIGIQSFLGFNLDVLRRLLADEGFQSNPE